jgi:hypothetical protein
VLVQTLVALQNSVRSRQAADASTDDHDLSHVTFQQYL